MKQKLTLLFLFFSCLAFAQADADLLTKYAAQISQVKTLQSDFTEEKHLSLLNQPIQSTGRLSFDKQAQKLYWHYQTPFQNGFLIEKNKIYRLQGATKTPVKDAMGKMMAAQLLVWLTLDFDALQRDYEITLHGAEIAFTPRAKAHKVIKQIVVWLDEKNPQLVKQVKMEEPSGDFILWKFSNTHINFPVTDEDL